MPRPPKGEILKHAPKPAKASALKPSGVLETFMRLVVVPGHGTPTHPTWLRPYAALLDSTLEGPQGERVVHYPPRVGKSLMQQAALIYWALTKPGHNHLYICCTGDLAAGARTRTEQMAARAGLEPQGSGADLYLRGGTKIRFTSAHASLVGHDCDGIALVDDPVGSREEYDSPSQRAKLAAWYESELRTRFPPTVIVTGHRWGSNDLQGWLIEQGASYLRVPMLADGDDDPIGRASGEVLWPERFNRGQINLRMRDQYTWLAMYQGTPPDQINSRFGAAQYYRGDIDLILKAASERGASYRWGYGLDLAYVAKSSADYSVLFKGVLVRAPGQLGTLYVTTAVRMQAELEQVTAAIKPVVNSEPGTIAWHMGPNESDVAARLRRQGFNLKPLRTQGLDKLVRARRALLPAWNANRVLINENLRDRKAIVEEIERFTGTRSDRHDDCVDALCALADALGLEAGDDSDAPALPSALIDMSRVGRAWRTSERAPIDFRHDGPGSVEGRPRVSRRDYTAERRIRAQMRESGLDRSWYPPTD